MSIFSKLMVRLTQNFFWNIFNKFVVQKFFSSHVEYSGLVEYSTKFNFFVKIAFFKVFWGIDAIILIISARNIILTRGDVRWKAETS